MSWHRHQLVYQRKDRRSQGWVRGREFPKNPSQEATGAAHLQQPGQERQLLEPRQPEVAWLSSQRGRRPHSPSPRPFVSLPTWAGGLRGAFPPVADTFPGPERSVSKGQDCRSALVRSVIILRNKLTWLGGCSGDIFLWKNTLLNNLLVLSLTKN